MIKNILPTDPITGEFKHLYVEGITFNKGPKKLYITSNITEVFDYITFDVEHDGNTYPFLEWEQAIEFYNKL